MESSRRDALIPQLSSIITHRFNGLERVPDALQMACKPRDDDGNMVIKVALLA